jgi:rod shape-determining protein MreD
MCVVATIVFAASPSSIWGLQLPEPVFALVPDLRLGGDPAVDPGAVRRCCCWASSSTSSGADRSGSVGPVMLLAYAMALILRNMMTGQSRAMIWVWFAGFIVAVAMTAAYLFMMLDSLAMPSLSGRVLAIPGHNPALSLRAPADRDVRRRRRQVPVRHGHG